MSAPLRFHACAPPGQWLNDPNALFFANGRYRLYAQHRADAPDFAQVGWAGFASDDLLHWEYEGVIIPPTGTTSAFSGSIAATESGLEIWYTEDVAGIERQLRIISRDGGASWSAPVEALGPPVRDWRDPFTFHDDGGSTMLLARTCGWSTWAEDEASRIEIWRKENGTAGWTRTGQIGPWHSTGIMWEVPVLVPNVDRPGHRLILSEMDRRDHRSEGHVVYLDGDWRDEHFEPLAPVASPLDCGPDFYAAIPNLAAGWPLCGRTIIGWASSWQTARRFPWPGFHGGPISLPRRLTARGSAPLPEIVAAFAKPVDAVPQHGMGQLTLYEGAFILDIASDDVRLRVVRDKDGKLSVERSGEVWLAWQRDFPATGLGGAATLTLFVDGPLVELHIAPDDRWVTAVLPVEARPFAASQPFKWFELDQPA